MRVLFVNSSVSGGGAGKSLVAMVAHLDRTRIEPVILLPRDGTIGANLRSCGAEVLHLPLLPERFGKTLLGGVPSIVKNGVGERLINLALFPRFAAHIARIAVARRIDVIHANHLILNTICVGAARRTGLPVVLHMRDLPSGLERWFFARQTRAACVKKVICISSAVQASYLDSGKVQLIHNTVDLGLFDPTAVHGRLRTEYDIDSRARVIGFSGRLVAWKGVDLLLRAFRALRDQCSVPCVLAIVGGNDPSLRYDMLAELKQRAQDLGVTQQTRFLGFQPDVRPFIVDFDVAVVPSVAPEPFGRTIIEAMALGVPVVGAGHGGISELISDGHNGLKFAPGSAAALSARLAEVLSDPVLLQRLAANSRASVARRFDARTGGKRFTDALLQAAGR